eukprot:TRINITY_DN12993_c0_g1_i1.p1 TRINITY_DN12993_c0_g1~~TRINITY_DN12993_c0_g1_i1.p1  ORF type:complete len:409 (-),score=154.34 TRINITY_DN12993_c0_g1_i1:111-1337(-)
MSATGSLDPAAFVQGPLSYSSRSPVIPKQHAEARIPTSFASAEGTRRNGAAADWQPPIWAACAAPLVALVLPAVVRRRGASRRSRVRSTISLQALRNLTQRMPQEDDMSYDGLDDLELEEELEEEEAPTPRRELTEEEEEERLGMGILALEKLWNKFQATDEDPELNDEELLELHEDLRREAPRCPKLSTITWMAHALERMGLEDDDTFEVFEDELVERKDELKDQPEAVQQAVNAFGNIFWSSPEERHRLLKVLADLVRNQLSSFTLAEVAEIANNLQRMGATDSLQFAGLFFEMSKRVYLPTAEQYIKEAASRDGSVYEQGAPELDDFMSKIRGQLPPGSLGPEMEKRIRYECQVQMRAQEEAEAKKASEDAPAYATLVDDVRKLQAQYGVDGAEMSDEAKSKKRR